MTRHRAVGTWLRGQGACADRIRKLVEAAASHEVAWPATLRTAISFLLSSFQPSLLFWGETLRCFCNDAALPMLGRPERIGDPGETLELKFWQSLAPALRRTLAAGEAAFPDACLSPVFDDDAPSGVGGVLLSFLPPDSAERMEALGRLTGGVAHDFNNLLGAIVGSLDLIGRKADDPARVRRLAEAGLKVAERGTRLTGQLLTFSRGQPIELKPVYTAPLLRGMQELLERTLGAAIHLVIDATDESCVVLSDATQLEMAVLNLAVNARDAMPRGGTLTVFTGRRDAGLVEVVVEDNGTGMTADVTAMAFDPFFTTKGTGKGTGLGLSQVYGIARQAGGAVRIDSVLGQGTAVAMLLPSADLAVAAPDNSRAPSSKSRRIIVVDDDPDLREVVAASLGELGHRVLKAADGEAALALLGNAPPDLLITDLNLPGMTGAELAIAARARWPTLPIVFASGNADPDAIAKAAGPATRLLRKPFRIDELRRAIDAT